MIQIYEERYSASSKCCVEIKNVVLMYVACTYDIASNTMCRELISRFPVGSSKMTN